jgi:hypothetical protein
MNYFHVLNLKLTTYKLKNNEKTHSIIKYFPNNGN